MPNIQRKERRLTLVCNVKIRQAGCREVTAKISDLSRAGCRLDLPYNLRVHETIYVRLPGLMDLEAVVCWVKGFSAGVEFPRPIHEAVFNHLCKNF
ncbi:PilZ domain-containing protein [Sphingomicrobium marinum]|uniref:PilZ domain-containing protein n=1 Tax=Sphingomicrobium marinum TaxID=1227950 RepID=UPI003899EBC4